MASPAIQPKSAWPSTMIAASRQWRSSSISEDPRLHICPLVWPNWRARDKKKWPNGTSRASLRCAADGGVGNDQIGPRTPLPCSSVHPPTAYNADFKSRQQPLSFCHFTLFVLTEVLFLCLFCNFRLKLSWVETLESGLLNNRNFTKSPLVFTFINSLLEFIFIKTVGVYIHKWAFVARKAHFSDHGGQTAKSIAIALVWILDPTHLCFGFLCVVVFFLCFCFAFVAFQKL